jgi:uncharacterized damage-inducible protein DinB
MTRDIGDFVRSALIDELEQLHAAVVEIVCGLSDGELWKKPLEPGNSVGHLILHLTGNLNHFAGAQLARTGYVREREREFTETAPPGRDVVLANLKNAVATFRQIVTGLGADEMTAPHPEARLGSVVKGLMHLVNHFALHRGQMSYIARLVKSHV